MTDECPADSGYTFHASAVAPDFVLTDALCRRALALEQEIVRLDARVAGRPHMVYGAEARLAGALLDGALSAERFVIAASPDPAVVGPPLERFLFRPPIEAAAAMFRDDPELRAQQQPAVEMLASCVCNAPRRYRTRAVASRPDRRGSRTVYPDVVSLSGQLERRASRRPEAVGTALGWAIVRLIDFVSIHPLEDGNGRVARVLFFVDLAVALGVATPCLPLGPLMYLNADRMVGCYRRLHATGDAHDAVEFFLELLARAVEAGHEVAASDARDGDDAGHEPPSRSS